MMTPIELMLVNAQTGIVATDADIEKCTARAIQILESPYSSPEQIEWAMMFVGDPVQYLLRPAQSRRARQKDGKQ